MTIKINFKQIIKICEKICQGIFQTFRFRFATKSEISKLDYCIVRGQKPLTLENFKIIHNILIFINFFPVSEWRRIFSFSLHTEGFIGLLFEIEEQLSFNYIGKFISSHHNI